MRGGTYDELDSAQRLDHDPAGTAQDMRSTGLQEMVDRITGHGEPAVSGEAFDPGSGGQHPRCDRAVG